MVNLLVDTSIFIDHFRTNKNTSSVLSTLPNTKLHTSVIVVFELERGQSMAKPSVHQTVEDVLNAYSILPITPEIAALAGQLEREQQTRGNDAFIAATCLIHNCSLVTKNHKDFITVKGLKIYHSERNP